jgi:hypothetical protein
MQTAHDVVSLLDGKGYTSQVSMIYTTENPNRWEIRVHFGFNQAHGGWFSSLESGIEAMYRWATKMPEKIRK